MIKNCPLCNSTPKVHNFAEGKALLGKEGCEICGRIKLWPSEEQAITEWNKYVDLINSFKAYLQPNRKTIYDCIREMSKKELAQFIMEHFGVHYVIIDDKTRIDAAAVEEWLETEVIEK